MKRHNGFEKTEWSGKKICAFERLDSTNITAKQMAEDQDSHGMVILADEQTSGKGSKGRKWESCKGAGVYMSLILKPEILPINAPMLTLVMALAVADTVRTLTTAETFIKWPNDILIGEKKVCGILTEMRAKSGQISYVVIGVGVNVNTKFFPETLQDKATSIYMATKKEYTRDDITEQILIRFEEYYKRFCQTQDLSALMQEYLDYLIQVERKTKVIAGTDVIVGTTVGINKRGELLIRKEDGTVHPINSGEVTVRGSGGYI